MPTLLKLEAQARSHPRRSARHAAAGSELRVIFDDRHGYCSYLLDLQDVTVTKASLWLEVHG